MIAKIRVTLNMSEDPEWLKEFVEEEMGEDSDVDDKDVVRDAISSVLGSDPQFFFQHFDDVTPIEVEMTDE